MSDDVQALEEQDYLKRYPDVAEAVLLGHVASARVHYDQHGQYEGRTWSTLPPPEAPPISGSCDVAIWSEDAFFVEGWADDRLEPIAGFNLVDMGTGTRSRSPAFRCRRMDVEQHLGAPHPTEFGLWTAGKLPGRVRHDALALAAVHGNGSAAPFQPANTLKLPRREFFEHLLSFYGRRTVIGNTTSRSFAELNESFGELVTDLYAKMKATRRVTARADFRFGSEKPRLSLICVLYGIPDFLYLLVAQFARFSRLDAFEFIFVSNSPELEETLIRDAELAATVFRTHVRMISLNQNCGFSNANNVGIEEADSDAIVVINPDVFPRDAAAVTRLMAAAEEAVAGGGQRTVVGGKLYYSDGTVMHDGMFFDPERKLTALCGVPVWTVEHFRKGFADRTGEVTRPVPAISGALMIFDRGFFRRIGGFDEDFVYGHYEDADLCLRARADGGRVLLDPDLAYWHYEGKGSIKRPEHVGSGLYNRWLFSQRWGGKLEDANHV